MKSLEQHMAVYSAYHRHPLNRFTHFIGVPAIVLAILIVMGWARVSVAGFEISLAMVFAAMVLVYYFLMDRALALGLIAVIAIALCVTEPVAARWPVHQGAAIAAVLFVGGWIFQLIGHGIEGRRPALVDNLWQVFIAPLFLMAEVLFAVGCKRDLKRKVETLRDQR